MKAVPLTGTKEPRCLQVKALDFYNKIGDFFSSFLISLNRTVYMEPKSRNFKVTNRTDIIHHIDANTSTLL